MFLKVVTSASPCRSEYTPDRGSGWEKVAQSPAANTSGLATLRSMENGETTAAAAARETLEEAGARIELGAPFSLISVPYVNQVHLFYRARLLDLDFKAGEESLEVALCEEAAIPWKEIAFRTVAATLRHWFADRVRGVFGFHAEDILSR